MNGLVHNNYCGSHQEIEGIKPQNKYWKNLFSNIGTTYQQIFYIISVIILALSISDYSLVMDIFRHDSYNLLTVYFSSSLSKRTPSKKLLWLWENMILTGWMVATKTSHPQLSIISRVGAATCRQSNTPLLTIIVLFLFHILLGKYLQNGNYKAR